MENQNLDIVALIEKNPITRFNNTYDNKLIEKLKSTFNNNEQRLFLSSFYCYLNYDKEKDFIIELNNIWKWLGFSRIEECKRVLIKHFVNHIDYKIVLHKLIENFAPQVGGAKKERRGGHNKETILLNIKTFKKLCLKSNTKKADEIHDYFIKLEEILHDILIEESKELQSQLQEQQKKIEFLQNKPETEGFNIKAGYIYLIKDSASLGAYKIGLGENPDRRLITLNISSSQKSLKMLEMFKSNNMRYAEKMIHVLLEPFRIKKRNEWFYLSRNIDINYVIHIIRTSIEITDKYSFVDYNQFQNYAETLPDFLQEIKDEKDIIIEKPNKYTNTNFLCKPDKISQYNGVSWCIKQNKWVSRLTKNNDTISLGHYQTEKEAAIIYNDYASYLNNNNDGSNYRLNEIENYIPNPRNIPEEINKIKLENKSSLFNGIYFIKSKQIFEASIQYKKKSYKLFKHIDDIECAKVYNEQALYFNNHLDTNYKLNEIPNFITIERNHIADLELTKTKKYSRFIGVSVRNDSNKFRAYIKYNGKRIDCGTFKDEFDAAKAYNKKAEELNKLETTKIKYTLNQFDE